MLFVLEAKPFPMHAIVTIIRRMSMHRVEERHRAIANLIDAVIKRAAFVGLDKITKSKHQMPNKSQNSKYSCPEYSSMKTAIGNGPLAKTQRTPRKELYWKFFACFAAWREIFFSHLQLALHRSRNLNRKINNQKHCFGPSRLEFRNLRFGICLIIEICYLELDQLVERPVLAQEKTIDGLAMALKQQRQMHP